MVKVLFVCVHNSARSQMAEAFLNKLGNENFIAESAGLEPAPINPLVVRAMGEIGYDISQKEPHSVFNYFNEGRRYSFIVRVCDQVHGQRCPIFPLTLKVLDWNFEDPSEFTGTEEEKLEKIRILRDNIKENVLTLINDYQTVEKPHCC